MKKLKMLFMLMLFSLSTMITSCNNNYNDVDEPDSTTVENPIKPEFDTANEFYIYAHNSAKYSEFIYTVKQLHKNTIMTIATAVINKHGLCTWESFMDEYNLNKPIYTNVDETSKKLYPELKDVPIKPNIENNDTSITIN